MMRFDLPRDTIFEIREIDVRLDPGPHPLLKGAEEAVAARWKIEKAAKPALFDGEVVLLSRLTWEEGKLSGTCHAVRYSQFLYWRSLRPVESAEHAYAHPILVAEDNALVAIRMASHTFNAGKVYFASGSFEPVDFPGGRVDVDFNMRREALEEIGVDLLDCAAEPKLFGLSRKEGTVFFRRYFSGLRAAELARNIRHHAQNGGDDEIEDAVILRSPADLDDRAAGQMPPLVEWHFSQRPVSGA